MLNMFEVSGSRRQEFLAQDLLRLLVPGAMKNMVWQICLKLCFQQPFKVWFLAQGC